MAEQNPPVWMQSGTYNAVDDRMVTGLLSDRDRGADGEGSGILGGVVPGFSQLKTTAPGTTMQVNVSTGAVIVPAPGATPPGAYICYNEGTKSFTLDIEATSNPRIDVIYAEVEDQTTGGDESVWRLGVVKGAPSASPVSPTLTTSQFPLAAVRVVPASQNGGVNKVTQAQITDLRRFNTAPGGVHLTRNGLPNPPHAPGRLLYNEDADYLYISDGANWKYFLTYQGWMDVFASVRPKHASISTGSTIPTGAGPNKDWDATPPKNGATGSNPVTQVVHKSPSGRFKVSISSFGRASATTTNGHVSVRVLEGSTTRKDPGTGWNAISFYTTAWEHHGTSFMLDGLPTNTDLTFRLEFYRSGADAGAVYFNNSYIMVEPIL